MQLDHSGQASLASDSIRRLALDEDLKATVLADPRLAVVARRIARRYIGGDSITEALTTAQDSLARGHQLSLEYMGESVRSAALADAETEVFEQLVAAIVQGSLPSTVSLDLSHIGLLVDPEQGYRNAYRLAVATADAGVPMMISAEGSDRTDLVVDTYERLAADHHQVGITIQARLHRSPADLDRLLRHPGRIRLVKGAFFETTDVAFARDTAELQRGYLNLAERILAADHAISVATHDAELIQALRGRVGDAVLHSSNVEFEMLLGLGTELLAQLSAEGFSTREYIVFGSQWWLYVLNRIAEDPARVFGAVIDAVG